MKLKYFLFGFYFAVLNGNVNTTANIPETKINSESKHSLDLNNDVKNAVESVGDVLQQNELIDKVVTLLRESQDNPEKTKESLEIVCELLNNQYSKEKAMNIIINNKESEKFYAQKNARGKAKTRTLLLKVIIPLVVTAVIFYALYYYYSSISLLPDIGFWTFFSDVNKIFKSSFIKSLRVVVAIAQLSAVGEKANSIVVDVLRIINGLLFLKDQFSFNAFRQGAYYVEGWLIFDMCHLAVTIYNDFISKEKSKAKSSSDKNDLQFEQIGKALSSYLLPVSESAASLYLALHHGEKLDGINAAKPMQAVYSLTRILPVYLKAKHDFVDAILAAHILIVLLDFSRNLGLYSEENTGENIKSNMPTQNKPEENKPKDISDKQPPSNAPEKKTEKTLDHTQNTKQGGDPIQKAANYKIEERFDKKIDQKQIDPKQQETPTNSQLTTQNLVNISTSESTDRSSILRLIGEHKINDSLLTELKQKLDNIISKNPEIADGLAKKAPSNIHEEDSVNKKPIDTRSIRIILEEKLKHAEALADEIKHMQNKSS